MHLLCSLFILSLALADVDLQASDMDKNWQKDLKIDARERGNELRFINDPRGLPGEVPSLSAPSLGKYAQTDCCRRIAGR
jgi:hypothetical protein